MKTLILASQSPRRSQILKNNNIYFVPYPVYVSEISDKNLSINDQIIDIARRKAHACLDQYPHLQDEHLILSADTMVCIDNEAIGKAENRAEAFNTLKKLSDQTHFVKTAIHLLDVLTKKEVSYIETSDVKFKKLSDLEIETYLNCGEYTDKAGSYGLQGKGKNLVKEISGDYNNIIGLPLNALLKILNDYQWNLKNAV